MAREIRTARPDDAEGCLEIYRPLIEETAISFELEPPTVAVMRERMNAVQAHHPWLVAVNDGEIEGYAYARSFRNRPAYGWTAETTLYVRSARRGLGIGRGLGTSLIACLRLQRFRTLVSVVALPNPASIRLHQALGYRSVGVFHHVGWKLGRWHDTAWYELDLVRKDQPAAEPSPVLAPGEIDPTEWAVAARSGLGYLRG